MAIVITIANIKGGVCKTTIAQALADELRRKGKKTLLIDLDGQRSLTRSMAAASYPTAADLLDDAPATEVIQHTDNGDIIAASRSLKTADAVIRHNTELRNAIEPLQSEYDYIIIDTPGNMGALTTNALTTSNYVVIPVMADAYSIDGLEDLTADINKIINNHNPGLKIAGIVVNRYDSRANFTKSIIEELEGLAAELDTKVLKPFIRECVRVKEAQERRVNLFSYAPSCNAAQDYKELSQTIIKNCK